MKVLKKITLKDLNNFKAGVLKGLVSVAESEVFVGRIVGSVRSQSVKPSPYGDALCFKGTFVGYSAQGEEARAVVCYLPSPVDEMLSAQINDLQGDKTSLDAPVDFALDVFAVADKCEAGYKYICKPLLKTKVADPIAALLANVPKLAIAAPQPQLQLGDGTQDGDVTPETPSETPVEAEKPAKTGKK